MDRPKWTKEPPKEPGLYWYQLTQKGGRAVRFQRVSRKIGGELVVYNGPTPTPVDHLIRLWAGPLLEPEADYDEDESPNIFNDYWGSRGP